MKSRSERVSARMRQGNALWIHSAASRSDGRIALTKWPSWWRFWHRIVLPRSPEANTSLMVEQFRRSRSDDGSPCVTSEHPPNWMIRTARQGATKRALENRDLRALGEQTDQYRGL